jgi:hypothetical protein
MEDIIDDVFVAICATLESFDKVNLISSSKKMNQKQMLIYYDDPIDMDDIIHHKMYHNFTQIIMTRPFEFHNMRYYCGHEIESCNLPKNVKTMHIDRRMQIPNGVRKIYFATCFNYPIDDMIPNSVRKLSFGASFNQNIIGCVPYGVTSIKFGYGFNKPIATNLDTKNLIYGIPDSVTTLKFCEQFNHDLIKSLPKSVEKITLGLSFLIRRGSEIPHVKTLILDGHTGNMPLSVPPTVVNLKINFSRGYLQSNIVPQTVKRLFIAECVILHNSIPNGVRYLEFGDRFNSSIKDCIPDSVIEIKFGNAFDKSIKKAIPLGVEKITFGANFSCQLLNNLPASVTHVILGGRSAYRKQEISHIKKVEIQKHEIHM